MKRKEALLDELIFPGGKLKAFTASYDDGTIHDRRLVEIFNRYGIKGTFNLNSGFMGLERKHTGPGGKMMDISVIDESEVPALYEGHEVAGHGLNHASPTAVGTSAYMYETIEDKDALEHMTGKLVRGYAYPFGVYGSEVKEILRLAGYHYARVVETTGSFGIPEDFLEWKGTCHHADPKLMELAAEFVKKTRFSMGKKLFYLWGHSYEFAGTDNWELIEKFCAFMQENGQDVWFATNIEIYDYVTAYRSLEYSADASKVYNPSALEVSLMRQGKIHTVKPLETAELG